MTIKSLRNTLQGLPADFDDRVVRFCVSLNEDGDRVIAEEEDIMGSMMPDDRNVYLLMGSNSMEYIELVNPDIKESNGEEWQQSSL